MGNTNSSTNRNSGSVSVTTANNATPPRSLRVRGSSSQSQAQGGSSSGSGGAGGGSSSLSGGSRLAGISSRDRSNRAKEEENNTTPPQPPLYPQEARVDNGHLLPLSNIYPNATQDWLRDTVQSLIVERKLAPFYRGLEDYDDDEDSFDRDALDKALDEVGDERAKLWRKTLYNDSDRKAEASMYKKASECPICFL